MIDSCYEYKVYKIENANLIEIKNFDFSDIEVKGEFDEIEYLYLPFPNEDMVSGISIHKFLTELIQIISKFSKIRLVIPSSKSKEEIYQFLSSNNIDISGIECLTADLEEIWLRDSMPTFARKKTTGENVAIKMHFDMYGRDDTDAEYSIEKEKKEIMNLITQCPEISYIIDCNYVQDGGARQFNGKGTCMLCENYERKRNPGFSKEKTENLFKKVFGVSNFIWLPYASVWDDSDCSDQITVEEGEDSGEKIHTIQATEGHIDGLAVFANPTTILQSKPDNKENNELSKENTRRMKVNLNAIKEAVDREGKSFDICDLPGEIVTSHKMHPSNNVIYKFSSIDLDLVEQNIENNVSMYILKQSMYINFIMTNGVVVNNSFYKPGLDARIKESDEECIKTLTSVYPQSQVFMIDAEAINWGGGSLHCLCAHQAK